MQHKKSNGFLVEVNVIFHSSCSLRERSIKDLSERRNTSRILTVRLHTLTISNIFYHWYVMYFVFMFCYIFPSLSELSLTLRVWKWRTATSYMWVCLVSGPLSPPDGRVCNYSLWNLHKLKSFKQYKSAGQLRKCELILESSAVSSF